MDEGQPSLAAALWKRSSACASGTCVEIAMTRQDVHMRDSERIHEILTIRGSDWARFVAEIQGEREPDGSGVVVDSTRDEVVVGCGEGAGPLRFARDDWNVFLQGVRAGEFEV